MRIWVSFGAIYLKLCSSFSTFNVIKQKASFLRGSAKSLAKLFNYVVCNPCQSSSSLTTDILVSLWFIIISLMFFYLFKVLFSGFLQFNGNFVDGQNNSKYRDRASLNVFAIYSKSNIQNFFIFVYSPCHTS